MKLANAILITPVVGIFLYLAAFFILGRMASYNTDINRFYSKNFYALRKVDEAKYLNDLKVYRGHLYFSVDGRPGLVLGKHKTGIGFIVPASLKDKVSTIASNTFVEVRIGKSLSKESIGVYHNELRSIDVVKKSSPKVPVER